MPDNPAGVVMPMPHSNAPPERPLALEAQPGLGPVCAVVSRVAPSSCTVLIQGETGTGKELLAREIHARSRRAGARFVAVHCGALSETLLESELFGHEAGAFTGASQTRMGRFEHASGGTIFLDEVADVPARVQVLLLRVLQEREVERVGANEARRIDVRVLAATNRDLDGMVRAQAFRADLFYRLNVVRLFLPALRERRDDIVLLAEKFVAELSRREGRTLSLSSAATDALRAYDWPGNVRQLRNALESAVLLAERDELRDDDVLRSLRDDRVPGAPLGLVARVRQDVRLQETLELEQTLASSRGCVAEAARRLGIPRSTLQDRLRRRK